MHRAKWDLAGLLSEDCQLALDSSHDLDKGMYPGYAHRLTIGMKGPLKEVRDEGAQVHVFKRRGANNGESSQPTVELGEGTSVTIVTFQQATLDDDELCVQVESLLQGRGEAMTVLDIRRAIQSHSPVSTMLGRADSAEPDTRQLNRILYSMERKGSVRKGEPLANGTSKKPMWTAVTPRPV